LQIFHSYVYPNDVVEETKTNVNEYLEPARVKNPNFKEDYE